MSRAYIDLSEDEIRELKKEILRKGTDNFNMEEYNISKDCYDLLVEEIIAWGINSYEFDDGDDYWEERERAEWDDLYYDDEYEDD